MGVAAARRCPIKDRSSQGWHGRPVQRAERGSCWPKVESNHVAFVGLSILSDLSLRVEMLRVPQYGFSELLRPWETREVRVLYIPSSAGFECLVAKC